MTGQRTWSGVRRRRVAGGVLALVLTSGLAGCTSTVSGSPGGSGSTPASSADISGGGPAQPQFDLVLQIVPGPADATTPAPVPGSDGATDLVPAVLMVLAGVEEIPAASLESADVYSGTLDGMTQLSISLPGTTEAQIAAARGALTGTWDFGLRSVTTSRIDAARCAILRDRPQPDELCDVARNEVLQLGVALAVRPSAVTVDEAGSLPSVTMSFRGQQRETIAGHTAVHVGDRWAVCDGRGLIAAPLIEQQILDGAVRLTGNDSARQARALAGKLQLATIGVTISTGS